MATRNGLLACIPAITAIAFRAQHRLRVFASVEDLGQDILLICLQNALSKYDSTRASLPTYLARVAQNYIAKMTEQKRTVKWGRGWTAVSLDHLVEQGQQFSIHSCRPRGTEAELLLSVAVRRVVGGLPLRLQTFAALLAEGATIAEAAAMLNISRASAFRRRTELARAFERAGLTDGTTDYERTSRKANR
jgi:hypothetical protein